MHRLLLIAFCIGMVGVTGNAFPFTLKYDETQKLLKRLDLDTPGLDKVKSASSAAEAAEELLRYYQSRNTVKHPVDPALRGSKKGQAASPKDLETADNALQHIFTGQPSYPPHFCGEDIDWSTSPVPDKEWVWQLNRMTFWSSMAAAYWHTGEEKYAKEWCIQLMDWVKKNPRDEKHQYAWRSIETGIRGHGWTLLFQHFLHSPYFTPEVLVTFLNSCYDHAAFLNTRYTARSNWGLMEAEGMGFIGLTFPEFNEAEGWVKESVQRLNKEITNQVYPDGHQRELSFGYHIGCINWFMRTYELAGLNGKQHLFTREYTDVIEKMCEIPMKLAFPNGVTPQFGDSWAGKPGQYYPRLKEWAKYFNRPDFLYVATEGREGTPPDATAFSLETSGLHSMRSGWNKDAICLVLKCGPDGGGHCQPDNGTFELYAGERQLMPDAGSYIYSGDPKGRAWFRQTGVHQTLTLNGQNSAYAPKRLLWETSPDLDILVIENQSYDKLKHRRAVLFVEKKYFVIVDEALGSDTGDIDIHFQLAPGEAVYDNSQLMVRSDYAEGWNVSVRTMPQKGLQLTPEEGQVSFIYTQKEARPAFRYRIRKDDDTSDVRFLSVVVPYQKAKAPDISARFLGEVPPGSDEVALEVDYEGQSKIIRYKMKQ